MTTHEFGGLIQRWVEYWERKPVTPKSMDRWFDKVRKVDSTSLSWIASTAEERNEKCPPSFVGIIWALYQEWQEKHPDQRVQDFDASRSCQRKECSEGLLHVYHDCGLGYSAGYVFRCGECRRSTLAGIPEASWGWLMGNGYTVENDGQNYEFGRKWVSDAKRQMRQKATEERA
jgi:hypothetical protein